MVVDRLARTLLSISVYCWWTEDPCTPPRCTDHDPHQVPVYYPGVCCPSPLIRLCPDHQPYQRRPCPCPAPVHRIAWALEDAPWPRCRQHHPVYVVLCPASGSTNVRATGIRDQDCRTTPLSCRSSTCSHLPWCYVRPGTYIR